MKTLSKFFALLLLIGINSSCKKDEPEPDVLKVLGLTEKVGTYGYQELEMASDRWFLGFPADKTNPLLDETGALSVSAKQPIPGFTILPSNFGGKTTRTLTIPSSDYLYITPLAVTMWYYDKDACDPTWQPAAGQSLKDFLFEALVDFMDISKATVSVKLDGTELMTDKTKVRTKTDVFEATIHKDFNNPNCDYTGKKAKMVADVYSVLVKIPKGKHTLVMRGFVPADKPENVFEAEVTWNLTVE